MSACALDGTALAERIARSLKPRIDSIKRKRGRPPGLLVIASTKADRASGAYRRAQLRACADLGLRGEEAVSNWRDAEAILKCIRSKKDFDAVIFDLPLSKAVDVDWLLALLPPERDAEGATPDNFGRLFRAKSFAEISEKRLIAPCTAMAIAELLRRSGAPVTGKNAIVIGRSNIVGKPAAHLLGCLDLTVTLCHSKTKGLPALIARADVVVACIGRANAIKGSWIKRGAIVIDAGVNANGGKLCGDVDPKARARAGYMTPVPGGVGPVTTAMLIANTVALAEGLS